MGTKEVNMNIKLNIKKSYFNEVYLPYLNNTERFTVFYGGAGSGKSVFVHNIIMSLIMRNKPEELKLMLIDSN